MGRSINHNSDGKAMKEKTMVAEIVGYRIVSFDGVDHEGVRAEVSVQVGTGTVTDIELGKNGETAHVIFKSTNHKLVRPVKGWIRVNDPLYEVVKAAVGTNEVFEFRIETSRKPGIDRKTNLADLDKTSQTTARLVGINGKLTSEALTDPREDDVYNTKKTFSAVGTYNPDEKKATETKADTPTRGQSDFVPQRPQASAAAKSWRALAGSYGDFLTFVAEKGIPVAGDKEGRSGRVLAAVLAKDFSDVVNAVVSRKHPDYSGGSSDYSIGTRALGYSLIHGVHPLSDVDVFDAESRKAWKNALYFDLADVVSMFDAISSGIDISVSLNEGTEKPEPTPEPTPEPEPEKAPQENADDFTFPFPFGVVIGDGEKSTPEDVTNLANLTKDSGVKASDVTNLIRATFGVVKVAAVDHENMVKFLDAYKNPADFARAVSITTSEWKSRLK